RMVQRRAASLRLRRYPAERVRGKLLQSASQAGSITVFGKQGPPKFPGRTTGGTRVAFDAGFTHYDEPPPGELGDIERLRAANRFRFANVLQAWIDVDDSGQITGSGYSGHGLMGSTMVKLGPLVHRFLAVKLPDLQG